MKKQIVYKTKNGYVVKNEWNDSYTVYANVITDYDGIKEKGLQQISTYATYYIQNHRRGTTMSIYWEYDPLKTAIEELDYYTR